MITSRSEQSVHRVTWLLIQMMTTVMMRKRSRELVSVTRDGSALTYLYRDLSDSRDTLICRVIQIITLASA